MEIQSIRDWLIENRGLSAFEAALNTEASDRRRLVFLHPKRYTFLSTSYQDDWLTYPASNRC
jgi:hypothetical protein